MENTRNKGKRGEELAMFHLVEKGFEILALNWQKQHLEIDIIAREGTTLVFAEVKSRSSVDFGDPITFVDPKKQARIIRAANLYLEENPTEEEVRFDIIGIWYGPKGPVLEHIPDAFYPLA